MKDKEMYTPVTCLSCKYCEVIVHANPECEPEYFCTCSYMQQSCCCYDELDFKIPDINFYCYYFKEESK